MSVATAQDEERAARGPEPELKLPNIARDANRPLVWVRTVDELREAVDALMEEPVVGLDVETTLSDRALCLVQLAGREKTYLVDALEVPDLEALGTLLGNTSVTKVIHYAAFERSVLGRHGFVIEPVVDTRDLSRARHGVDADGGHTLRQVCARELLLDLDKREQTSDWTQRPLSDRQVAYAALDAEVLLQLVERFSVTARQ